MDTGLQGHDFHRETYIQQWSKAMVEVLATGSDVAKSVLELGALLPPSPLSDIKLVAWTWPWQGNLHNVNWQILQIKTSFSPCRRAIIKYLSAQSCWAILPPQVTARVVEAWLSQSPAQPCCIALAFKVLIPNKQAKFHLVFASRELSLQHKIS